MRPYIINDLHLGTQRVTGTTQKSQEELRKYLLAMFAKCLRIADDDDLIILGDLFDNYNIPTTDILAAWDILADWLKRTGKHVYLVAGNHDLSKDSTKVSSFRFFAEVLKRSFETQVTYVEGSLKIGKSIHIISHVTNQDLFDLELASVGTVKFLLVHANYDNNFAKEADHSLNISAEQIAALDVETVVFAHEHYAREAPGVKVLGNQFPSSVSDCLGEDVKYMHRLTAAGVEKLPTWESGEYAEVDWQDPQPTDAKFVRLVGKATQVEAHQVPEFVSQYRRNSDALVVGNAIRVNGTVSAEGMDLGELDTASLESIRAFDVKGALKSKLSETEWAVLEGLK